MHFAGQSILGGVGDARCTIKCVAHHANLTRAAGLFCAWCWLESAYVELIQEMVVRGSGLGFLDGGMAQVLVGALPESAAERRSHPEPQLLTAGRGCGGISTLVRRIRQDPLIPFNYLQYGSEIPRSEHTIS